MVPTRDPSLGCLAIPGFYDRSIGSKAQTARHGQIPPTDLSLRNFRCMNSPTNTNPEPTTGPAGTLRHPLVLCTEPKGLSGGVFYVGTGTYVLTVPADVDRGSYIGTVVFLLVAG